MQQIIFGMLRRELAWTVFGLACKPYVWPLIPRRVKLWMFLNDWPCH